MIPLTPASIKDCREDELVTASKVDSPAGP
jgi:hypothetical protein